MKKHFGGLFPRVTWITYWLPHIYILKSIFKWLLSNFQFVEINHMEYITNTLPIKEEIRNRYFQSSATVQRKKRCSLKCWGHKCICMYLCNLSLPYVRSSWSCKRLSGKCCNKVLLKLRFPSRCGQARATQPAMPSFSGPPNSAWSRE